MNKLYSRLGWFTTGVIAGIVGVLYYQVFGKPALPKVEKCKLDFSFDDTQPVRVLPYLDVISPQTGDTQPVRTHD